MTGRRNGHMVFPFRIGTDGRTAPVLSEEEHTKDELIQLLLTNPKERSFLPNFGGGLRQLIFSNIDETRIAMAKSELIQEISTWLGHRITLVDVDLNVENEKIEFDICYRTKGTEKTNLVKFQRNREE